MIYNWIIVLKGKYDPEIVLEEARVNIPKGTRVGTRKAFSKIPKDLDPIEARILENAYYFSIESTSEKEATLADDQLRSFFDKEQHHREYGIRVNGQITPEKFLQDFTTSLRDAHEHFTGIDSKELTLKEMLDEKLE